MVAAQGLLPGSLFIRKECLVKGWRTRLNTVNRSGTLLSDEARVTVGLRLRLKSRSSNLPFKHRPRRPG